MRHKSLRLLLIFALGALLAPLAEAQLSSEFAGWAKGPEGFLLTKKEKKEWDKMATDAEAKRFIELFWARRNPEVSNPYNSFKAEFDAKVKFADDNFSYPGHRGSVSDRAKVLILMGRPENRQVRGPTQAVQSLGTTAGSGGTDAVAGGTEVWQYNPAALPPGFKVKGSRLLFMFYEEKLDSNNFSLDRSNRESFPAMSALTKGPEAYLLHPELKEVPKPISVANGRSASPAHLAWCDQDEAPFDDSARVIADPGMSAGINQPLWVHIELPPEAPPLDLLVGRVKTVDGEDLSNFEIDAKPLKGQYGSVYHLSFPLDPGSYTVEIAGASGGALQVTERIETEVTTVPTEGTWLSPVWFGITADPNPDAPHGAAFTFGGWHLVPISGPDLTREAEIAYFGFLERPVLNEEGAVDLKARVRVKKDGKPLGKPFTRPLDASLVVGDLYMYGNSIALSGLPEPGSYELEFMIIEETSETSIERSLPLEISD
jgi:GWxTD domain-containing protein